ncbi:M15 family metallopeptidase [Leifsonia sp. YIM 134122]|uniref:M15 family metallopeptidase n=1 Tax=Leifsonia stereocauli TaxID=3134136 RepID=A0ABU9VZC0_9MICO
MSSSTTPSPEQSGAARRVRSAIVALVAVAAAVVTIVTAAVVIVTITGGLPPTAALALGTVNADAGGAGGEVGDGVTVFDDEVPAVAGLDPALLDALRRAATDAAADDDLTFTVNSGWRSPEYQEQLLHEAVAEYGSEEEAARWVATAETSPHVSGDAIDLGPWDATYWLSEHGAEYGLCQIYANESWHFELRPDAVADGCPAMYEDPTFDPRMRT